MQTNYNIDTPIAFNGMLSDTTQHKDVLSLNNRDTDVFVGRLVSRGVNEDEIIHPAVATDVTDLKRARGVVLHSHQMTSSEKYLAKDIVSVLHKGRMWVQFMDAPDSKADVRVVVGGADAGRFASTGLGSIVPNCKIIRTSNNNFAEIEIDL